MQIRSGEYPLGGEEIRIRVPLDQLDMVAEDAESATEDVIGRVTTKGVVFTVSDCASKVTPARED